MTNKNALGFSQRHKPNKHRIIPAKARGFRAKSLQVNPKRAGISKRYVVDQMGTIWGMDKWNALQERNRKQKEEQIKEGKAAIDIVPKFTLDKPITVSEPNQG